MAETPTLMVVAVALSDAAGRFLLQQRLPGRAMAGLWEFPGGKIEADETAESALVRELDEELGIAVAAEDLAPACFASAPLDGGRMILLLYRCRRWRGDPRPLDASALLWATPGEMRALDMPPADGPLVDLLERLAE